MKRILFKLFIVLMVLSMVVGPVSAQTPPPSKEVTYEKNKFEPSKAELAWVQSFSKADRFIVLLEEPSLASLEGEVSGFGTIERTDEGKIELESPAAKSYLRFLKVEQDNFINKAESTLGRKIEIGFRYDVILNGFSAKMSAEEALKIKSLDGVENVLPVTLEQPDTDAGPTWIGAPGIWDGSTEPEGIGTLGEGILVGILDTGINFDHPSFSDDPEDDFIYTWTGDYLGVCSPSGDPDYASACNDKLVGAYSYTSEALSPEDADGHGSHTASTVAGNYVTLDYMGVATTISGVAPHAQIIAYDVCDPTGCYTDSSTAAIQQAITDGVDVINYSISGGKNPYSDAVELAFLEAFDAGIFVAASAGNLRDEATTDGNVNHVSPWIMTVAASSHNRKFTNDIDVVQPAGSIFVDMALIPSSSPVPFPALDDIELKWAGKDDASISDNYADNREGCSSFPADFFKDDVALIQRGICLFSDKLDNAKAAGAIGMLLYADDRPPMSMGGLEAATLPAGFLYLSSADAVTFESYVDTNAPVLIDMSAVGRYVNNDWGDIKADFSFRGPSANNFEVLKPEITAPGLEVLAAIADYSIDTDGASEVELYQGTSMSSPHTAGVGALIKALYPTWSAAEIKSAIMLTAKTTDLFKEDMDTPADLFDFGSGRVDLTKAGLTGLIMDETYDNFVAADPSTGGDAKTLNIPSYQNSQCVGECSFTRTFTSVADSSYTAIVDAPDGVVITVDPASFDILAGGTQEVVFDIDVMDAEIGTWQFATVTFATESTHPTGEDISDVRIPLAIKPDAGNLPALIEKDVYRDAGGVVLEDLYAIEITDLTVETVGLTEAELFEFSLAGDPDLNKDPFDNLDDVWYTTFEIPNGTKRVVMEILDTSASDLDLFFGFGPTPSEATLWDYSATGAALEYLSWVDPIPYQWWVMVQNWGGTATPDDVTLAVAVVPDTPSTNLEVTGPATVPGLEMFDLEVTWDVPEMEPLSAWYGWFSVGPNTNNPGLVGQTELNLYRRYDDVTKEVDLSEADFEDVLNYTITIAPNRTGSELNYVIEDVLPEGVTYVKDSLQTTGSTTLATYHAGTNTIKWAGVRPVVEYAYLASTPATNPDYCDTPSGGYLDLKTEYDYDPLVGLEGDSIYWSLTGFGASQQYYGKVIPSTPTFTSDGYFYMFPADVFGADWWNWVNQAFPDPTAPNGIVAPWMRDMVIQYEEETKGVTAVSYGEGLLWVIEFDDIVDFYSLDDPINVPLNTMDFQIWSWRELDPSVGYPDLVFAFDNVVGDWDWAGGPWGSIGLENEDGTNGTTFGYDSYTPATGDIVCFDYAEAFAEPVVITFQAIVDSEDETLITNSASHTADGFGMLAETATTSTIVNLIEPVADDQNLTTDEEVALDITLTGTGLQPGPVTWTILTDPEHGTLSGIAPDLTYTPDPDFYGSDSFTFKVNDGLVDSNVATISIDVTNVNDAPGAEDDFYTTDMDVVLNVAAPGVLENDFDADPTDAIIADVKDEPIHGKVVLNQDGSFTYTPDEGFFGEDSFTYYMLGIPMPKSEYTDSATVTITVNPPVKIYFPLIFK